jgi:hypothetical protein
MVTKYRAPAIRASRRGDAPAIKSIIDFPYLALRTGPDASGSCSEA